MQRAVLLVSLHFALRPLVAGADDDTCFLDDDDISVFPVSAAWARDTEGRILPRLVLSTDREDRYEVTLSFRVTFADKGSSWTSGPFAVEAGSPTTVDVSIPVAAGAWSDRQSTFFSDLHFSVRALGSWESSQVESTVGPPLRLIWSSHDRAFILYDTEEARTLGPYGFVGTATEDIANVLREEDVNIEFGPGI